MDKLICVIFQVSHMSGIMWHLSFSLWFTSLRMIIFSCIHVVADGISGSFSWLSSIPVWPPRWPQWWRNHLSVQETQVWSVDCEDPRRRKWQSAPVFLPGKSHRQRSLTGYSSWGCKRVRRDWASKQQQLFHCIYALGGFLRARQDIVLQDMITLGELDLA